MLNKRGQFYIVTAIIIILVVIGLLSTTIQTFVKPTPSTIYELSSELNQEGSSIIDYGIYSGRNITELLSNFTEDEFADYFLKKTQGTEIAFLYGNQSVVYLTKYNTTEKGKISLALGGSATEMQIKQILIRKSTIISPSENVSVQLMGLNYKFQLRTGENFYFIIGYQEGEEVFIEKSSDKIQKD